MTAAIDVAPEAREQVASDLRQAAKKAADAVGEILRWSYMLESEPDAAMKSMRSALCSTVKNRNGVKAAAAETALTVLAPKFVNGSAVEIDDIGDIGNAAVEGVFLFGPFDCRGVVLVFHGAQFASIGAKEKSRRSGAV